MSKEEYRSRVYTDRPAYADFDAPRKFESIKAIIAQRLIEHPSAICSYSGGADSDIMIDLIERTRAMFDLPPIKYVFFNTGLEMKATKDHVKAIAAKYGAEIEEIKPKIGIVTASRIYGVPFLSKAISEGLGDWQKKNVPLSISCEFIQSANKIEKRRELRERYPKCESLINFICGCDYTGNCHTGCQLNITSKKYLLDFINEFPPDFAISEKCCKYCKKNPAKIVQKPYSMIITGERAEEGGQRSIGHGGCFEETASGQYRLRPLYYVTNADKDWYKNFYGIRYSDAYEVYGLTRTGCCGCPISYKAVDDLEKIRPFEPNVVEVAWNIFGDSYRYRQRYNEYKQARMAEDREKKKAKKSRCLEQISLFDGGGNDRLA